MRIDLYGLVHKAQRYYLFAFAQELSRADLEEPETCVHVARRAHHIFELLVDHAQNEARYIHPLFAAVGNAAEALDEEHRAFEVLLDQWLAIVREERWPELYRATMRLIGEYLLHIDAEERAQKEILWPRYEDPELGAVMMRFKAERDPVAAQGDLALFIPALSVPELVGMLRNLRAAPEPLRRKAFALAKDVLAPAGWSEVERRLME